VSAEIGGLAQGTALAPTEQTAGRGA